MLTLRVTLPKTHGRARTLPRDRSRRSRLPISASWTIQPAPGDRYKPQILQTLLAEKLNPLSLDMANFVVASAADGSLAGFGQVKPLGDRQLELSSLVVYPQHRGQGLGCQLVEALLSRVPPGNDVFLVTVTKRRAFYERCGFAEAGAAAPAALQIEVVIGTPIAALFARDSLILMSRRM